MIVNELFDNPYDKELYLSIGLTAEELTIIRLGLRELKHYHEDALTHFKGSHSSLTYKHSRETLEKVNALLKTLNTK